MPSVFDKSFLDRMTMAELTSLLIAFLLPPSPVLCRFTNYNTRLTVSRNLSPPKLKSAPTHGIIACVNSKGRSLMGSSREYWLHAKECVRWAGLHPVPKTGCCQVRAQPGKTRCRFHGGKSTSPKTQAGGDRAPDSRAVGLSTQLRTKAVESTART
jgi:hypothetical protein